MTAGAPDWQGLRWKTETVLRPSITSGSGRVISYDDFETPTQTFKTSTTGTSSIGLTTNYSYTGSTSVKLSTGATAASKATFNKIVPITAGRRIGTEFMFTVPTGTETEITITPSFYDGVVWNAARITWYEDGDLWKYFSDAAAMTAIPDGEQKFSVVANAWNRLKIVTDFDSGKYVYLKCNEKEFDLSDIEFYTSTLAGSAFLDIQISLLTRAAEDISMYIDDFVVTEEGE